MLKIKQFTFNPVQENTYVVYNEKGVCAIVDPGCYFEHERRELTNFIDTNQLFPKCLLNTHCHLDHIFGNKFVHDTYGLSLYLHEKEKIILDNGPSFGLNWGLPFENYEGELIFLKENDLVKLGDDVFTVLFTPGHSPGSISYHCPEQQFVLSGDVLFRMGIGRTDLPLGDYNTLISSITERLFILPGNTVVYSGHGVPTTIDYERQNNPFLNQAAGR